MDLTPETLRSATFRDKLRGYHPDDVDEFLESVARGLEVLLARLRDASEKARSVVVQEPMPEADEAVRTLSLAQRTADLAIHEAKTEAERLLNAAEQRARKVVGDAEETAVRLAEEAQLELRSDLEKLQTARDQLFGEVSTLGAWLKGERGRIRRALVDVADRVEAVREPIDAPKSARTNPLPPTPRQRLETKHANPAPAEPAPAKPAKPAKPASARPAPPAVDLNPTGPVPVVPAPLPPGPAVEAPRPAPPAAAPAPHPQRQPTPPGGQPAVKKAEAPPMPPQVSEPSDGPVLQRAHESMTLDDDRLDDDPYFAELRAAMNDDTPLGPREDEMHPADGVAPDSQGVTGP